MRGRFIIKHIDNRKPQINVDYTPAVDENKEEPKSEDKDDKKKMNEEVMTTSEKIAMAQNVLNDSVSGPKRIKKDKGLIERTESSRTILTEDNKELLKD